jgi:hypothetical protein
LDGHAKSWVALIFNPDHLVIVVIYSIFWTATELGPFGFLALNNSDDASAGFCGV